MLLDSERMFLDKKTRKQKIKDARHDLSAREFRADLEAYFLNIALKIWFNFIKFENLPNDITSWWIMQALLDTGKIAFYKMSEELEGSNNLLVLKASSVANYDIMGNPTILQLDGYNRVFGRRKYSDVVMIWESNSRMFQINNTFLMFAKQLAEIRHAEIVNIKAQKTTQIIECEQDQENAIRKIYDDLDGGQPVIFGRKNYDLSSVFNSFETPAEFVADKLIGVRESYIRELLTYLGVNNSNVSKRERLITDEVEANNEHIYINRSDLFQNIKNGIEEVNERWGYNIQVSYNGDNIVERKDILNVTNG